LNARPDLDASTVARIRERHIVDVEVLYNIGFIGVLAERTDADAMRARAVETLDDDVGAVGLEGNAICSSLARYPRKWERVNGLPSVLIM